MIGYQHGVVFDETRRNWEDTGPRPIGWNAWYPAANPGNLVAAGVSDFYVTGALLPDAPFCAEGIKHPLVLLSHGTGGSAIGLTWLAEALAKAGCLVVGANHHGNTGVEDYRAEGFLCWWERPKDLTILLNHLLSFPPFQGHIDESRISAVGFSLGGYTVLSIVGAVTQMDLFREWSVGLPFGEGPIEFPKLTSHVPTLLAESAVFRASWERQSADYRDERISRVVALAPAPTVRGFEEASLATVEKPVVLAVGGADQEAPAEDCAVWLHERLPNSELHLLGPDVGHYTLLAQGTDTARSSLPHLFADAPSVDRDAVHRQVIDIVTRAFGLMPA